MSTPRPFTHPLVLAAGLTLAGLTLGACGSGKESGTKAPAEAPSIAVPPAAEAPPPRAVAIQTQDGPDGMTVALTRARVTGSVLTVQLSYERAAEGFSSDRYSVEEVAVIDDATSQRYGALRDASGRWQASPLQDPTSNFVVVSANPGEPAVVWFKFPAPPATSPTVSITVPGVGPFDGVTVQR